MFPMGMVTQRMTQGRWRSKLVTSSMVWTVPLDVGCIWVGGCSGGSGGGGGNSTPGGGGGGGAPGYALRDYVILVNPNDTLLLSVGSAGLGGAANNNGTRGGNTQITRNGIALMYLSNSESGVSGNNPNGGDGGGLFANGGIAGGSGTGANAYAYLAFAETRYYVGAFVQRETFTTGAAGGALNYNGGSNPNTTGIGGYGSELYVSGGTGGSSGGGGGAGGNGPFGYGGAGGSNGSAGSNATGYGSGGGGGSGNSKGGDGTPGLIQIYCFTAYEI